MLAKAEKFLQSYMKKDLPDIQPGCTVRVSQKVKEGTKERIQVFEGLVLARKHGKGVNATITVRKVASGVGVEKVFPIHAVTIEKIEVTKKSKVRRAKLYYLRDAKGKRAKLKKVENIAIPATAAKQVPEQAETAKPEEAKA
ncbi:MAG: 50S ribosomal protein L19 [Candidatus Paceibacterota bacterium]|jgi:large subunit ribosomal protein L19